MLREPLSARDIPDRDRLLGVLGAANFVYKSISAPVDRVNGGTAVMKGAETRV